jgi:hypothetical protein
MWPYQEANKVGSCRRRHPQLGCFVQSYSGSHRNPVEPARKEEIKEEMGEEARMADACARLQMESCHVGVFRGEP